MGYKEIIQYLDDFPFLHKQEYSEGSVAYEIVTKNMFPDDCLHAIMERLVAS